MFQQWMDTLRARTRTSERTMYLGKKKVEIKKLTPNDWKKLFGSIEMLPGLIVQVALTPKEDIFTTMIQAVDIAMDEIVILVSILTGIDEGYIANNVALDELYDYLTKIAVYNRFDTLVENFKDLFPKQRRWDK